MDLSVILQCRIEEKRGVEHLSVTFERNDQHPDKRKKREKGPEKKSGIACTRFHKSVFQRWFLLSPRGLFLNQKPIGNQFLADDIDDNPKEQNVRHGLPEFEERKALVVRGQRQVHQCVSRSSFGQGKNNAVLLQLRDRKSVV